MIHDVSVAGCASVFRYLKAPNLVGLLQTSILCQWAQSLGSTSLGAFLYLMTEAERATETSCFLENIIRWTTSKETICRWVTNN